VSKHFTTGMPKCQNAKMRKTPFGAGFRYRELECRNTSPQEYRNVRMPKCEKHLLVQVSDTGSWSVEILLHRNAKCRNAEMRNRQSTLWINAWSQLWACEGRSLQVARLHFVIGSWKSQSDSQQIRETRNCEMQFRIRLWSQPVVTSAEDGGRS
jgi:hypothetical protein